MTGFCRRGLLSAALVALLCPFAATGAAAQQACGQFAASPSGKVDLFAGYTATFRSGDTLPAEGVFAVALRPRDEVVYPVNSESTRGGRYGGIVIIGTIEPGPYRIAVSGDARIDALQLYRPLPSRAVAWDPECPGEHRRIDITAADAPLMLQIDDAHAPRLTIAVYRRPSAD